MIHQLNRRSETAAAMALLGLIALLALGGIFVAVVQERQRQQLIAEYRAFQLAAELQQAFDRGSLSSFEKYPNLLAFGIYTVRGTSLYRYGNAPDYIHPEAPQNPPVISGDVISLVRPFGGGGAMRGRIGNFRPNQDMFEMINPPPMAMGMTRLVFVSYRLSAFRRGLYILYGAAILIASALFGAFALLVRLAKSLDQFRLQEARNRELVALGEAARTLSHEIKNPLGVLKIQTALLQKQLSDSELVKNVRIMEEEIDRLGVLTDRLRQFLSGSEGDPEPINLNQFLSDFCLRYDKRLALAPLSTPPVFIRIDRTHLNQVLDNLVQNGLESMARAEGATVELELKQVHPARVHILVSDRGSGIPESLRERVYDLFYTTKTTGSGLGLSISRRYVELAGGRLFHQNREGGGTTFIVELPLAAEQGV
ncbi:two-component system sensor histidine kinase NtrB [Gracilinema caldarium]|uniref:histidine kinase n=1 Tax=Gracilinema caldarium (strain ATCC 51460 / DSM 7334 / H1) TaxID=744872 RepID=F8F0J4_GRAC1|nr:HAMP domain-containing sensor histidine kinase [Gracilinema caldarium]AEJ19338.1 integral membrane sensor signal transduction histidine kinase [Gracilinema caldarium DSM 7334]